MGAITISSAHFLTFEGIDGSGKTTLIHLLSDHLKSKNISCLVTREPGGTPLAEEIRNLLLSPRQERVYSETELLLYESSRAQHVNGVIKPALDFGQSVICDRFCDATVAYQQYARGISSSKVGWLNKFATSGLEPDLTFFIDIPPEEGFARLSSRSRYFDRMESSSEKMTRQGLLISYGPDYEQRKKQFLSFNKKVRNGYLNLLSQHPDRIVKIDGTPPSEQVFQSVLNTVQARFGW